MILFGDLETFNEVDLKTAGTAKYAETAEIMLFPWAVDDGPVQMWDRTEDPELPPDLHLALLEADEVVFQNSWFDRNVLQKRMPEVCPPLDRWFDTMVQALGHSLPGSLDKLGEIFKLDQDKRKLKVGRDLVMLCLLYTSDAADE